MLMQISALLMQFNSYMGLLLLPADDSDGAPRFDPAKCGIFASRRPSFGESRRFSFFEF